VIFEFNWLDTGAADSRVTVEGDEDALFICGPLSFRNDMGDFDFKFRLVPPFALDFKFIGMVFFVVSAFNELPLLTMPFCCYFLKSK
jgi:hypothetical protein